MTKNETRVYTMRLPTGLVEEIRADQASDLEHGPDPAGTLTEWMIRAARERLAHRRRARARRRPPVARDEDGWPIQRVILAGREGGYGDE